MGVNVEQPEFLTDEQMRQRLGLAKLTKGLQFILVGDRLFHPTDGGWEAYLDDEADHA